MNTAINHAGLRPRKNVSSFHGKTIMPWKLALYFPPPVNVANRLPLDSFEIFICPRTWIYSFIARGTKDDDRLPSILFLVSIRRLIVAIGSCVYVNSFSERFCFYMNNVSLLWISSS